MRRRQTLGGHTHEFADLKALLAAATPERSGDVLAGVAAASEQERVAAQGILADLPLAHIARNVGDLGAAHRLDLLAQFVQLGLARHLVEAGAELRRHRPQAADELAELAHEDGQVFRTHHHERDDRGQQEL